MPCYHPLNAYESGREKTKNGKKVVFFNPANYDPGFGDRKILLPCGQCIGCRLDYSLEWAQRIMHEKTMHKQSWFITLTYNDENLPISQTIDNETGEYFENSTLIPKHLQDFLKRLRDHQERNFDQKIRFFGCGEYGDKNRRRHYHRIIFGLQIPDLKPYKISSNKDVIYTSEYLEKIWGKGFVTIGEVTTESRAYVRRYIMKKQKGFLAEDYKVLKIEPEFTRMSRKPGIGQGYYEAHKDMFELDEVFIKKKNGTIKLKPARYYEKKYDLENPKELEKIKKHRREIAIQNRDVELSKMSISYDEYLDQKEKAKLKKAALLKRNHTEE